MKRFLFEYTLLNSEDIREFSQIAPDESEARTLIKERIADLEFVDEIEVTVGRLIKTFSAEKAYYECESCT
jgi:hypothetical protein